MEAGWRHPFDRCSFSGTKVTGGDWSAVEMLVADLTSAGFSEVRMINVNLGGARCYAGAFTNIDFTEGERVVGLVPGVQGPRPVGRAGGEGT